MNSLELIESFSEFKDDKLINRETLMAILEEVFRNTLKKKYGSSPLKKSAKDRSSLFGILQPEFPFG